MKRQSIDPWNLERPNKKPTTSQDFIEIDDDTSLDKVFKFRVLLPNGSCLGLKITEPEYKEMPVKQFVDMVKEEYFRRSHAHHCNEIPKRKVNWNDQKLRLRDMNDNVIDKMISFRRFMPNKDHILRLHDGSGVAVTYENMWDLTPDTEFLRELPADYTFETALADLIDNSLQAVWSNGMDQRRLISVEICKEKISIFDTGPGMDGSDENSIVKWGKMGASLNRSFRGDGVGGKPPYLTPFFGMFGYGGSRASMHLGRRALVSSKTKNSKIVYTLHLQREALLSNSGSENSWRTDGGIRDPTDDELGKSSHGSFTKVEIFEPKVNNLDAVQLQNRLKDIYFPYIQCDELSEKKTITPVEFEVNGTNLAEIEGGEVAITNLESCNGPNFFVQLRFSQNVPATSGQGERLSQKANARLKFVYFPIVEGKESIEIILEKLKAEGYKITESFNSFSRVSIRRLGRLLPDARWNSLPFMKPKQQRGGKTHILKSCCPRVKCFIDTDAGFNPTPPKTELAKQHLFTTALENFGGELLEKDKDVNMIIFKDGKEVTLAQLEKLYQKWIFQMRDHYDKEVESCEDQPTVVLSPSNKKKLGISSECLRVHKVLLRKGLSWKSGQKIKILKGAATGCHKNNVHATLEYVLFEGLQGDSGGEARLICRPLAVPKENGCKVTCNDGNANIDIGDSLSLPVNIIDHGQCLPVEDTDWDKQVERQRQKQPSEVDLLSEIDCLKLEIDGALPADTVYAGHAPPKEIVAVVRPASFRSASGSKSLNQNYIVRDDLEIGLQIKHNGSCKYSGFMRPSSRKGFHGLYVFPVGCKSPDIFEKAGDWTFLLSLRGSSVGRFEKKVRVRALSEVSSWQILTNGRDRPLSARTGSCFPPISLACYDAYRNHIPFPSIPPVSIEFRSGEMLLAVTRGTKLALSPDKLILTIKDMLVESSELDCIRPSYNCSLLVSSNDGKLSTSISCQVVPGDFEHLKIQPTILDEKLKPGCTVNELILEMFDKDGNHVREGLEVSLDLEGLCLVDHIRPTRKVDSRGIVDLSGLLKVTGGYGSKVSLSVVLEKKIIFKNYFETEERELRIASKVQECGIAGSLLETMVFQIVNSEGNVDEAFHDDEKCGQSHTLTIKLDSLDADDSVKYSFRHGCCTVRAISLPHNEGMACFLAAHSRHSNLCVTFKVNVLQARNKEPEINTLLHPYGPTLLLENFPACVETKLENENSFSQFSGESLLLLQDSQTLKHAQELVDSNKKKLLDSCVKYGKKVGNYENALKKLKDEGMKLEEEINMLQNSLALVSYDDSGCTTSKEQTYELIQKKEETAASLICKILKGVISKRAQKYFSDKILGVVALLGTVQNYGLSRILAEYLGEDTMLAVVCNSYSVVKTLEEYDENGDVDHSKSLHDIATQAGVSISGRYLVISLEDTRPYVGDISNDPERKLGLPDPLLPNGVSPPGYLGYAVNMIIVDVDYSCVRTQTGHGLRETLFYRLFGKLQVYETRANMELARTCIKYGAVSLDGGIMRNGVLSLGNWQSKVYFPVISVGSGTNFPMHNNIEIRKQIEEKKSEFRRTHDQIEKIEPILERKMKKFRKKQESYDKFLEREKKLLNPPNLCIEDLSCL